MRRCGVRSRWCACQSPDASSFKAGRAARHAWRGSLPPTRWGRAITFTVSTDRNLLGHQVVGADNDPRCCGKAQKAIRDFVQADDIGLVAMATRGRSGVARLLFGSVATRTVPKATVPMLPVH